MIKRIIIFILGVFVACFGLILISKTGLGVSPIGGLPLVVSMVSNLSFGYATIIMYFVFVLGQIIITRKIDFKLIVQIPFSYLFGYILDFYNKILTFKLVNTYTAFIFLILGLVIMAFGAYMMVYTDLILNPVDGLIKEISIMINKTFAQAKTYVDIAMLVTSVLISFLFSGSIVSAIGIGTLISVLIFGKLVGIYANMLNKFLMPIVEETKAKYNF